MTGSEQQSHKNTGMQHYLILLVLIIVGSYGFYKFVIPSAVQAGVISIFKPHDDRLAANFKQIMPGLHAVATDKFSGEVAPGTALKPLIKTDYIFDFTSEARTEKKDGYTKAASEWVVKANGEGGLGEAAIILEPPIGFAVLAIVFGLAFALALTMFMPSSFGYMAQKVDREVVHNKAKIRLQTGFADEIVDLLTMPDHDLDALEHHQVRSAFQIVWDRTETADPDSPMKNSRRAVTFDQVFTNDVSLSVFRQEVLLLRIQEFFSDFVVKETIDTKGGIEFTRNRMKFMKGLKLYMSHHFTEKYSNNVTGLAYGGAAILIVIIGIRGLKFIPATKPSLILAAISLEGSMLALLAFTLLYTEEEERMDKLMKKMEDANKNQLETMKDVSVDMHSLADALVGETSEIIKQKVEIAIQDALASDENVKKVVSDKVAEKIIVAMRQAFPDRS
ncbi:MAG: hypothetical protein D8M52_02945 [Chlorobi bacterium]|nr:MAG: hypothetical protein F9K28_02230 [Bacteroidota bacterium]KXK33749.1 MAG: hypothetical protein UZ06_CHB003001720 [Chlorobi bacterium OLB6]MBE2266088.1 hypothetical protein [Flavobacteriales bacterium]MBL1160660.1 hypothetical protein [Chlorobiota bacterium]MBW7853011.1 hypothetical protein [Candidatus Kapabacteria bacterium]MCC6331500.1 hypothetical protein [Ignavibacteria bacterium]